uniref:Uncharacterized protein n=1 Tax=Rhizophora mucronata TaxID=61149 RepID=A0A2P2PMN2_RHIMU
MILIIFQSHRNQSCSALTFIPEALLSMLLQTMIFLHQKQQHLFYFSFFFCPFRLKSIRFLLQYVLPYTILAAT